MSEIDIEEVWRRAIQHHQQGRFADAVKLYELIIQTDADLAPAYANRGAALLSLGDATAALADLDRAIQLDPASVRALSNRGAALDQLGRHTEALASLDLVISLDPRQAAAHNNRGSVLLTLGQVEEAAAPTGKGMVGGGEKVASLFIEALASFDRALDSEASNPEFLRNKAHALAGLGRLDEALAVYRRAVALDPSHAPTRLRCACMLWQIGRPSEALGEIETSLVLDPRSPDAWNEKSIILKELGRVNDALAASDQALAIEPRHLNATANGSASQRMLGDFPPGLQGMEVRKRGPRRPGHLDVPQPEWLGAEDISGKTLFVHCEQGLGDTLQFCRYLPLLTARGARIVFSVQPELRALISTLACEVELIDRGELPAQFDYHTPLMSLPLALGTTVETIPRDTPYLAADAKRVDRWKTVLGAEGFKVGLCWSAGASGVAKGRTIPLVLFEPLSHIPNLRLISLQKGAGLKTIELDPPAWLELLGDDFDSGPDAFLDSAAVIENLDLVISIDTSIAHLAGALSRPVWTLLPWVSDWRWLLGRSDTPWYPTMRLFRHAPGEDWGRVMAQVQTALYRLA